MNKNIVHIEIGPAGKVMLGEPQQQWNDAGQGAPDVMQVSRFAGQELMAITDDAGAFDLTYLGFQARGFTSMESAKSAAPDFARRVLRRLLELISD
jgi:hypothetical protein